MAAPQPLQLFLFIDRLASGRESLKQLQTQLLHFQAECPFDLDVIDVAEKPYLVEHFRIVATPALVKTQPAPRQTLAGHDLLGQLHHWWPEWQRQLQAGRPAEVISSPLADSLTCTTEIVRLQDQIFQLEQDKKQLQGQVRFRDQILGMLAHDLRNPLTAIGIALETLELSQESRQEDGEPRLTPALFQQLVFQARRNTRVMDRLITELLQASKDGVARFVLTPAPVDLASLVTEVVAQVQPTAAGRDLTLDLDIPKELPPAFGDGERIRQVLINLLDNACKYTPSGGRISLSVLHRTTQKIQITVCDTGPGIAPENQERIFESKVRLDQSHGQEGYGLGLYLCRQIVQAHYGRIWVDSTPGEGSCFRFTLPVYRG